LLRNRRPISNGMGGRIKSESVADLARNTQLSKDIKQLEKALGEKEISLESFILSKTPYETLIKGRTEPEPKEEFKANHVLFMEDQDWAGELFQKIMKWAIH